MLVSGLLIFILTLVLVMYFVRKTIYISHEKRLFDEPSETRKIHLKQTPNLGGVAIFTSMMFASCIILSITTIPFKGFIISSCLLLFLTGLTDDLVGMDPFKKIGAQLLIALATSFFTDFRITNFYGLFGIYQIPFALSVLVSTIFIIYVVNAFNLIDGINCLAGSIGLLTCLIFTFYFWRMNDAGFMLLSIAMCGCLVGFLYYNRTPAQIFMGDTGSLFLGFFISLIAIHFLETYTGNIDKPGILNFNPAPKIVLALLIIPIYDTLRVFTLRIANGKSPFMADSNHIHHQLLKLKLSHLQATGVLLCMNIVFICVAFLLQKFKMELFLLSVICLIALMHYLLFLAKAKLSKQQPFIQNKNIKPKLIIVREREIY